jgi:hypothetical protein
MKKIMNLLMMMKIQRRAASEGRVALLLYCTACESLKFH